MKIRVVWHGRTDGQTDKHSRRNS